MNHLNPKILLSLGGAALVAVFVAGIMTSQRQPVSENTPAAVGSTAVAELKEHINDVKTVTLTVAEDKPAVTLTKSDKGWTVKEKGGYAADTGQLRDLLLKLGDAALLEQKTASEQRYPELGVEDVKNKDAKGVKLTIDGLSKPVQLIVGNVSAKSGGTFVRHPDDKQSWLAKGALTLQRDPAEWIDKSVVDIAPARIVEIALTRPGGKPVRVYKEKPEDANFKIAGIPAGKQAAEAVLSGLASTLSGLTLTDVLPLASAQMPGEDQTLKAVYRTAEGLKINIWGWKKDDKHYARLSAVLEQSDAEARIQADQAKAKTEFEEKQKTDPKATAPLALSDPGKDREQRLTQLASEVSAISQRVEGWAYVIPPFKYGNMDKSMDDLLQPATAATADTPKAATPSKAETPKAAAKPAKTKQALGKKH